MTENCPPIFPLAAPKTLGLSQAAQSEEAMTSKTWIGGHAGNAAGSGANWSPHGAPKPGDHLTVVTGTLEIGGRVQGDTLHLNDQAVGGGPVTLDLNGNANVSIDGSLFFGDPLTVNAVGEDAVNAAGGFEAIQGSINLAAHAHLFMETGGSMKFDYGGAITGGKGSSLTNNGRIEMTNGTVSTLVNGTGTLAFDGYHDGPGLAKISAKIASTQTVELNAKTHGLTMVLADPADFRGLLKLDPPPNPSDYNGLASVVVSGVHAGKATAIGPNLVMLTKHGQAVDLLRLANAGSYQISATDSAAGTTLTFHAPALTS